MKSNRLLNLTRQASLGFMLSLAAVAAAPWLPAPLTALTGLRMAYAQSATDVPAAYASHFTQAKKMGEATLRWYGLKVYDAQLWSEKAPQQFNYRTDRHVLELKYDKSLDGDKIAEKSREEIEEQGVGTPPVLQQWQKKLTEIMPNVQNGTRLAAVFVPGKGFLLYRDGQLHAEVNDPDLATAFMGIWLDPKSSQPKLREKLIGLRK